MRRSTTLAVSRPINAFNFDCIKAVLQCISLESKKYGETKTGLPAAMMVMRGFSGCYEREQSVKDIY